MTVDDIREIYFTDEAWVEQIPGIDGECLLDSFEDPDETREARLFEDLDGWGRERIGGKSTGIIWYSLKRGGIVVLLTNHEIHLFLCSDPEIFNDRLAQVRTTYRKKYS
jgi:hypothetical protein